MPLLKRRHPRPLPRRLPATRRRRRARPANHLIPDTLQVTIHRVIRGIRHAGLKRLYEKDDRRRVDPAQVDKIRRILARLDEATGPSDMDLPGWRLHRLRGDRVGSWAVSVSGNWRIVFRFEAGDVVDVDWVDYH